MCLLAWVKEEEGRVAEAPGLLDGAKKGQLSILTSTVSIVEVANAVTIATGTPDLENQQKIDNPLGAPSPVHLVDFHRLIAEDARDLVRSAVVLGRKLTPLDAVHLATAKRMGVDAVHTYENRLKDWSDQIGIPVVEPTCGDAFRRTLLVVRGRESRSHGENIARSGKCGRTRLRQLTSAKRAPRTPGEDEEVPVSEITREALRQHL